MPERKLPSSSTADEGRFPAGMILGERYKVLGLLGRGGMGEVYRAHDLKLEQQVALKFLPMTTARDARLLERFRGEVRIARQVSHRNVCRVYDLGEVDGAPFISMEYVDGEDLGSLLRRIGRLPGDKAIEFARRLCAGLAAAHEKGVLHRDLKPSNIMIDGRGQILIMDFGLAAAADAIAGGDIRSGTPAYMAPEQKEGREVTVRSDIYSLGLVLAEMFTGQRDMKSSATAKDLDPAVEKVILRCLDPDPSKRPQSALDVSRALPGGDPLAEALAAGDTPSPEMVAASEDTGALSVRAAVFCFAFGVVGLMVALALANRGSFLRMTPVPDPSDVLVRKARDLAKRLGYADAPADSAYRFDIDSTYGIWANQHVKPDDRRSQLAQSSPPELLFWYRESPQKLIPANGDSNVTSTDPPQAMAGDLTLRVDTQGRLVYLSAVASDSGAAASPANWSQLFEAAGLDPSRWSAVEPQRAPVLPFDQRAAWTGSYPSAPSVPLRIDAAAWKGRPVHFEIQGPWTPQTLLPSFNFLPWPFVAVALALPLYLAWRNYGAGRGDLHGASRLAAFILICNLTSWLCGAHNWLLVHGAPPIMNAAMVWVLYIALEPYVRRRWPQSLISWSRLLSGGLRDPLVGGHILVGVALGVLFSILTFSTNLVAFRSGEMINRSLYPLSGMAGTIYSWSRAFTQAVFLPLIVLFVVFLARVIFRMTWIAAAAVVIVLSLLNGDSLYLHLFGAVIGLTQVVALLRFGVFSTMVASAVVVQLSTNLVTADFSAWYAGSEIASLAIVLALALWAFRTALGGRKVWKGDLLEN